MLISKQGSKMQDELSLPADSHVAPIAAKPKRAYVKSGKYAKAKEVGSATLRGNVQSSSGSGAQPVPVKRKYTKAVKAELASAPVVQGSEPPKAKRKYVRSDGQSSGANSSSVRAKVAGDRLKAASLVEVDVAASEALRPLTGIDVEGFRDRHKLTISDMVHMLALQGSAHYNRITRQTMPLAFNHEFLLRISEMYPSPPPWNRVSMADLFDLMYGAILQQFQPYGLEDMARVVLYYRFTALFGRSSFTGYRWIEKAGIAKPELHKIAAKIAERQNPRMVAEDVARTIWRARGVEFDESFPIPTLASLSTGPRRGRLPGSAARRAQLDFTQLRAAAVKG